MITFLCVATSRLLRMSFQFLSRHNAVFMLWLHLGTKTLGYGSENHHGLALNTCFCTRNTTEDVQNFPEKYPAVSGLRTVISGWQTFSPVSKPPSPPPPDTPLSMICCLWYAEMWTYKWFAQRLTPNIESCWMGWGKSGNWMQFVWKQRKVIHGLINIDFCCAEPTKKSVCKIAVLQYWSSHFIHFNSSLLSRPSLSISHLSTTFFLLKKQIKAFSDHQACKWNNNHHTGLTACPPLNIGMKEPERENYSLAKRCFNRQQARKLGTSEQTPEDNHHLI